MDGPLVVPVLVVLAGLILAALCYYLFMSSNSQLFGRFPFRVATTKKILALTFDDGPNQPYTSELLGVLKKRGIKATFFIVGKNLERAPQVGCDIVKDGHCVGNHSYSHAFSTFFSRSSFLHDLEHNQDVISEIVGIRPTLFRPPWLFRLPWILTEVRTCGLIPVSGLFGSELEIFQPRAEVIFWRALRKAKPGVILIFHDGYNATNGNRRQTILAIDKLIPALKAQGYAFVTVPELLQASPAER